MNIKLKIKKLHPAAILPKYGSAGAACFDLAVHGQDWSDSDKANGVTIKEGNSAVFKTGLAFEIPEGYVMQVFSRSGHGFKNHCRLSNGTGIIDADYRGELAIALHVDEGGQLLVNPGDRIAQAMLVPIPKVEFEEVDGLSETARGEGGFGSTGVK